MRQILLESRIGYNCNRQIGADDELSIERSIGRATWLKNGHSGARNERRLGSSCTPPI
jgi:hypothetical protein